MKKKVLIVTPKFVESLCLDKMVARLKEKDYELKIKVYEKPLSEEELIPLVEDVDGYISGLEQLTKKVLYSAKKLKIIAQFGVGTDNIDIDAANKKGIIVSNAKGANSYSVAESTIALMLCLIRDIPNVNNSTKAGNWNKGMWHELKGKKLGIIGLGNVGKSLAKLANCFNMQIFAYDIIKCENFANKHNVNYVDLDYLIKYTDFVSLHVPLKEDTENMIAQKELNMMKPTAFLLNLARGGIVDEEALYNALKNKKIAGAALDVFKNEGPGNNPLFELDNVIAIPHVASNTFESVESVGDMAVENIIEGLEKKTCSRVVNKPILIN